MQPSRIVVKGYRSFGFLDVAVADRAACVSGENNTGKSNLIQALRLCVDVNLSNSYRAFASNASVGKPRSISAGGFFSRPAEGLDKTGRGR